MICNNCGHNNEDGKLNCTWCNFPLPVVPPPAKSIKKMPSIAPASPAPGAEPPMLEPRTARIHHDSSKPVKGKKTCPQCQYELILDSAFCPMCSFPFTLDSNTQPSSSIQIEEVPLVDFPQEEINPASSSTAEVPADAFLAEEPAQPSSIEEIVSTDFPSEQPAPSSPMEETPTPEAPAKTHRKSTTTPYKKLPERKMVSNTIDPFRRDAANEVLASFQPIARDAEPPMDPITVVFSDKPIQLNRAVLESDNNTITGKVQAELAFRDGAWYLVDRSEQETTFIRASGPVKLQKGDVILMGNRKFIFDC
jgi:hypothetical protein